MKKFIEKLLEEYGVNIKGSRIFISKGEGLRVIEKGRERNFKVNIEEVVKVKTNPPTFNCPERINHGLIPNDGNEFYDSWNKLDDDRVCSYCGSIHPNDLAEKIKKEGLRQTITPTTKRYKFYITKGYINQGGVVKFYTWHLNTKLKRIWDSELDKLKGI